MKSKTTEVNSTAWYVVHTKPRQEARALKNLQNQGFQCFLPTMQVQKLRNQRVQTITEPMFSRYIFIQLNEQTQNWGAIRSTLGVSKLVSFGPSPAKVPSEFIDFIKEVRIETFKRMFAAGDKIQIGSGPLQGLEGVYIAHDGEARALVLVDLLGKPQKLRMVVESLRMA